MLRSLAKGLQTSKIQALRFPQRSNFIRIKKKTSTKVKEYQNLRGESVIDDKFIKLTVRDETASKLKQLAKLREENLKKIHTHDQSLEQRIDDEFRKDFERSKITTKIDIFEEPLSLLSMFKESQLKTLDKREDPSMNRNFDRNILNLLGKNKKEMKQYLAHVNIERQINESFDVKVYIF